MSAAALMGGTVGEVDGLLEATSDHSMDSLSIGTVSGTVSAATMTSVTVSTVAGTVTSSAPSTNRGGRRVQARPSWKAAAVNGQGIHADTVLGHVTATETISDRDVGTVAVGGVLTATA